MRKLISLMLVSLDGFCAGRQGEMDWITMNDAIHADVTTLIDQAGAAVLWPHHLRHDVQLLARRCGRTKQPRPLARPCRWVEDIPKYTFSRTLEGSDWNNLHIRRDVTISGR